MDQTNPHSLHERVAVLEIQMKNFAEIEAKLDQLLELKSKGAGALWFVSILFGSGVIGILAAITGWFSHPHL